ncbi:MAG: hypothetical protein L0J70_05110, partial [Corynebacterium sp.]|nr:hypothetical protein [Corynebacterium sp.]
MYTSGGLARRDGAGAGRTGGVVGEGVQQDEVPGAAPHPVAVLLRPPAEVLARVAEHVDAARDGAQFV